MSFDYVMEIACAQTITIFYKYFFFLNQQFIT